MNTLICPISTEKVNKHTVRLTGFLVASTVVLYAITSSPLVLLLLGTDFIIRAFTSVKYSPLSWLASRIIAVTNLMPIAIDKAPKIFAARVGFLLTLTALSLSLVSPTASLIVMLVLMVFALLEALADFCVGCVVYTYIVLPLSNRN